MTYLTYIMSQPGPTRLDLTRTSLAQPDQAWPELGWFNRTSPDQDAYEG